MRPRKKKMFIFNRDVVKRDIEKAFITYNQKLILTYQHTQFMLPQSQNNTPLQNIHIKSSPEVEAVFNRYPDGVREKMLNLRSLVLSAAEETDGITQIEECLKWGEPSYLTKHGSTVRMDWKEKNPEQYAIYFKCTSKLVPTFRVIYQNLFTFEGKRAIVFQMDDALPEDVLKKCISAALTYHQVKKLPMLGLA